MKKITLIITILTAIGITSCKKGWLDESVNPNAPSQNTLPLALTSAEKGAADIINGWGSYTSTTWEYAPYAVWEGYWVESPNGYVTDPRLTQYQITTSSVGFPWTDLYDNLSNVNLMQLSAVSQNSPNYEAIALVLKAYGFEQLVDNFNNVPYSQAFQGAAGNLTPVYDTGQSIYTDLIKQMDNAIDLINKNPNATLPGSDDIIFGGNMTNWKKFANTMKLRLIMRQSNLPGFAALKTELASTSGEGYLDGTTQALANPGYALSDAYGGQENPFYLCYGLKPNSSTTLYGYSFWLANAFCVDLMQGLNDSRVTRFYQTLDGSNDPSQVVGSALGTGNPPADVSHIGPGLIGDVTTSAGQQAGATQSAVMFSGAESLFLQAEAVNDGMLAGTAATLYDAAITASFEATGAQTLETPAVVVNGVITKPAVYYTPDESAALYYAQASVAPVTEQNIITQKYIALNGFGNFEAYNEYRRTGYPNIPRSLNNGALGSAGQLPSRVFYPQTEYSTNPANVAKQPAATVSNEFNSKIFWAK